MMDRMLGRGIGDASEVEREMNDTRVSRWYLYILLHALTTRFYYLKVDRTAFLSLFRSPYYNQDIIKIPAWAPRRVS